MSDEIKSQWDWKLNWPKCAFFQCKKESICEHFQVDGFRFCKNHFELIQKEFKVILFDSINPSRRIDPNCKNKDWHYKTVCELGSHGGCHCAYCGDWLQDCEGDHESELPK